MQLPQLRYVDVHPLTMEGQRGFFLRDPLNFTEKQVFVSEGAMMVLAFLDGQRTAAEVRGEILRQWRVAVSEEQIEALVADLDQSLLLDSERFRGHLAELHEGFRAAPARAAFHAGRAYTGDAEELRRDLDGFLTEPEANAARRPLRGLIAPHIDFRRGRPAYGYGYSALQGAEHDLFVVFGTSHGPIDGYHGFYALTRKHYETPLGTLETPALLADALAARLGPDAFAGEFAHRSEHSIEFQAVWLQHLFGSRGPVRMLPVLCGSFQELVLAGRTPGQDPRVVEFLQAVREEVAKFASNPLYLAGADLAHIGPKFGDKEPAEGEFVQRMEAADKRSLAALAQGDPEGFVQAIALEQDRYRICGISSIYSVAKVLEGTPAETLRYGYWPDPNDTVSFVSAALYA